MAVVDGRLVAIGLNHINIATEDDAIFTTEVLHLASGGDQTTAAVNHAHIAKGGDHSGGCIRRLLIGFNHQPIGG